MKGIGYREGEKIILTATQPPIPKDYKLPFPARQLLPNEKYFTVISKRSPITSFLSSSGCPFSCIYCDIDRNVILRDPLDVVKEIEECVYKFGIKEIMFYDETFTLDKKRVHKICDEIIKRKIDIVWGMRTRVDCVDRELIFKMAKAGCIRANLGIESGDEEMLKFIKKYIPLGQIRKAVKWCNEAGMDVFGYFMMGLPNETRETIKKTIEFSKQLDLDYIKV